MPELPLMIMKKRDEGCSRRALRGYYSRQRLVVGTVGEFAPECVLTKEYIHALPHRQPWLHGAFLPQADGPSNFTKLIQYGRKWQKGNS